MGEKCASKNQFKSKLDFQNQQYKAQHKHTHMADYNNISESPFPTFSPFTERNSHAKFKYEFGKKFCEA